MDTVFTDSAGRFTISNLLSLKSSLIFPNGQTYEKKTFMIWPGKETTVEVKLPWVVVGVSDGHDKQITNFSLEQNFPNPFNPTTSIGYSLPKAAAVSLKVYDLLGKEVRTLVSEYKGAGKYSVQFNVESLPSGIYIYTLEAGNFRASRKLIILK